MRGVVSARLQERELTDDSMADLLKHWLEGMREIVVDRPPRPEDERDLPRQPPSTTAPETAGDEETGSEADQTAPLSTTALALWNAVYRVVERELDLFGENEEALSTLDAQIEPHRLASATDPVILLELVRGFLAADGRWPMTPEAFAARMQRMPPERLELPDGVTLSGASLTGFLESGHFPFGQYRVGDEWFFVTPSLRLNAEALENRIRQGPGQQRVGRELLVWQSTSFRVAAGTPAEVRDARPFVGPTGARAYLWLGPVLPGGPLVLRDANGAETRVPVPEDLSAEVGHAAVQQDFPAPAPVSSPPHPLTLPPPHPLTPRHPALLRAEEALARGEEHAVVERCLREVMSSPQASGEALSGAGRLWQMLGRTDVASAAFTMALERGSVEGALGLSRLAEATGEGIEAAARPLDAAVARNLRSAELHARYAELLARLPAGWDHAPQVEWHRRRAEDLMRSDG